MSGWSEVDTREIAAVVLLLLIIVGEIAFRLGRRSSMPVDVAVAGQVATMQAIVVGLLGLLLAFSFGMAQDRYEARRLLHVEEADVISTTYLRTDLLPDPVRQEVRKLLREYIDVRISYIDAREESQLPGLLAKGEQLHAQIWARVVRAAREDSRSIPIGLMVSSTNELIDMQDRVTGAQARVPARVLALLLIVAAAGVGTVGYAFGLGRSRQLFGTEMLALLISVTVLITLDLDRPRAGRIHVDKQLLLGVRESMDRAP